MVLVDSTRAGKRIPDALSKTVPIWCAVINRAIPLRHPENSRYHSHGLGNWDTTLFTPPTSVSRQEHRQIELRLDAWARALAESSFDLPLLLKPLRPFWITPSTSTFPLVMTSASTDEGTNNDSVSPFLPVVCVSASKQLLEGLERRSGGYTYIQGSGDDHELWGMGLDPQKFWQSKDQLLSSDRTALPYLIENIVSVPLHLPPSIISKRSEKSATASTSSPFTMLQPTPIARVEGRVLIASTNTSEVLHSLHYNQSGPHDTIYVITVSSCSEALEEDTATRRPTKTEDPDSDGTDELNSNKLLLTIPEGKRGQSHFLKEALPRSMSFIQSHLLRQRDTCCPLRICCVCDSKSGFDRSVGIALSTLQIFFNDDGNLKTISDRYNMNKDTYDEATSKKSIQTRLEWIISSEPKANPSRTTLKRVNEYLMSPRSFRHNS
ncbi:hypothetical protein AX15_004394 [Amanita polypyramis BW_CC]|nr:hypothetical protein AX15_004394 [Amanita polypyramis BW_CC]